MKKKSRKASPSRLHPTLRADGLLMQLGSGEICHLLAARPGVLGVMCRGGVELFDLAEARLIDREVCPGTQAVALDQGLAIAGQSLCLPDATCASHQGNIMQLEIANSLLVTLGEDSQLVVTDTTGVVQRRLAVTEGSRAFALDGLKAWVAVDTTIVLHDLAAGLTLRDLESPAGTVVQLRCLPQGLVALNEDGIVYIFEEQGWRVWPVEGISALGSTTATGLWVASGNGQALEMDASTGTPIRCIEVTSDVLLDVLEMDGCLVAASNRQVWMFKDDYSEPGLALRGEEGQSALDVLVCQAFSRDGRLLAVGDVDGGLGLVSTEDGAPRGAVAGHSDCVTALAFHPREGLLASGSADGTVGIWQLPSLESVHFLDGHDGTVSCLAFSPDGTLLATGGGDGQVVLWELEQGQAVHALTSFESGIESLAFSPGGELLSVGDEGGLVTLWDVTRHQR